MKNICFAATLLLLLTMTSCATMFLNKTYNLEVSSDDRKAKVIVNDSLYNLPTKVEVLRSKEDLCLTLVSDTVKKDFIVKSKLNTTFKYLNLGTVLPIGYLVDLTNDKRYYYGKSVFLKTRRPSPFSKKPTEEKGNLYLSVFSPHINIFSLVPAREKRYTHLGFWGIGAGFDYYYDNKKFINLSIATISDAFFLFPTIPDFDGDGSLMTSTYMSLSHNHRVWEDFTIGYGVSLSKNTWDYNGDDYYDYEYGRYLSTEAVKKSSIALGFVFPVELNIGYGLYLGMTYRPSFYRPELTRKFRYEATFSFLGGCKIGLIKVKKKSVKFLF